MERVEEREVTAAEVQAELAGADQQNEITYHNRTETMAALAADHQPTREEQAHDAPASSGELEIRDEQAASQEHQIAEMPEAVGQEVFYTESSALPTQRTAGTGSVTAEAPRVERTSQQIYAKHQREARPAGRGTGSTPHTAAPQATQPANDAPIVSSTPAAPAAPRRFRRTQTEQMAAQSLQAEHRPIETTTIPSGIRIHGLNQLPPQLHKVAVLTARSLATDADRPVDFTVRPEGGSFMLYHEGNGTPHPLQPLNALAFARK